MSWSDCVLSLIIPIVFIVIGLIFWKNPPKEINYLAGWRTYRAMKNKETWNFANRLGGKCFFMLGAVEFICTILILLANTFLFGNVIGSGYVPGFVLVQAACVVVIYIHVENKLKAKFYNQ